MATPPYEQVQIESRAKWRRWLGKHRAQGAGIWRVTWKKQGGHVSETARLAAESIRAGQWRRPDG